MHPRTVYYLVQLFSVLGFMGTTATYGPFLLEIGCSVSDIALLNVCFFIAIILAELPTGMLADGRSRAWAIRTGFAVRLAGIITYSCARNFWGALAGEVLEALGFAFVSGALDAWITDALRRRGEEGERQYVLTTCGMITGFMMLGAGAVSGFVGIISTRGGWYLDAVGTATAYLLARRFMNDVGEPEHRITGLHAFHESFSVLRRNRALQWSAGAAATFGLIVSWNHYWAPIFRAWVGPSRLSYVWIAICLPNVFASWAIRRFGVAERHEHLCIVGALLFAGLGMVTMATGALAIVIPGIMLHEFARGAFDPLMQMFMQRHINSSYRATYGSLQSLIGRSGFGLTLVGVWWFTRGAEASIVVMTGVITICGVLLVLASLFLFSMIRRRA